MTNVLKIPAPESPIYVNLLEQIKTICFENPHTNVAVWIKNLIDDHSIPIQMDRDLIRRLTSQSCNPNDIRFNMPLALMEQDFEIPANTICSGWGYFTDENGETKYFDKKAFKQIQ